MSCNASGGGAAADSFQSAINESRSNRNQEPWQAAIASQLPSRWIKAISRFDLALGSIGVRRHDKLPP